MKQQKKSWVKTLLSFAEPCKGKMILSVLCAICSVAGGFIPFWAVYKILLQHLIQEAISALTHGKTIITIAHRLATIENADQILVIDGGTVAQRGTHKELLQQEGTYKKFIQIREQAEGWRIQ